MVFLQSELYSLLNISIISTFVLETLKNMYDYTLQSSYTYCLKKRQLCNAEIALHNIIGFQAGTKMKNVCCARVCIDFFSIDISTYCKSLIIIVTAF